MAALNQELATIARDIIAEMREENWEEDDIKWSTCGTILKFCKSQGTISEDDPGKEQLAAIQALVLQVMKEDEPPLQKCAYCQQWHEAGTIEQCQLKP